MLRHDVELVLFRANPHIPSCPPSHCGRDTSPLLTLASPLPHPSSPILNSLHRALSTAYLCSILRVKLKFEFS